MKPSALHGALGRAAADERVYLEQRRQRRDQVLARQAAMARIPQETAKAAQMPPMIVTTYTQAATAAVAADALLQQAKSHFEDRAFSPFWDALENCYAKLAEHGQRTDKARILVEEYNDVVRGT